MALILGEFSTLRLPLQDGKSLVLLSCHVWILKRSRWMDAEICVRDLTDSFRYNCLPKVAAAIGWKNTDVAFEDLPGHERLL